MWKVIRTYTQGEWLILRGVDTGVPVTGGCWWGHIKLWLQAVWLEVTWYQCWHPYLPHSSKYQIQYNMLLENYMLIYMGGYEMSIFIMHNFNDYSVLSRLYKLWWFVISIRQAHTYIHRELTLWLSEGHTFNSWYLVLNRVVLMT